MSNALTEARLALEQLLREGDFRVVKEVPETYSPPLCWVAPRSPYRAPGQTFSSKRISLAVICVAAQGTNAEALKAVEELTSDVADLVDAADAFRLDPEEDIGVPVQYPAAQGQTFLGAPVNVFVEVASA